VKNYFIIEGANATGKSTLIEGLKNRNQDIFVSYSIPEDFQILRKNTYSIWSDKASLFYYLSANLELIEKLETNNKNLIILDRSIISSFSIYLSRIPEDDWNSILSIYKEFLKFMPEINKIYILKVNEEIRMLRIKEKSYAEQYSDLKEIKYENLKDKARLFLVNHSNIDYEEIDTSYLKKNEVINLIYNKINEDKK
jgi:thymidylate kinase